MREVVWQLFRRWLGRWGRFLAKAEGFGAIAGAVIAVLGAWWLTTKVQSALNEAEERRRLTQEQTALAFSVSKEATEAVGQVYWNGQRLLGFLDPKLEASASRPTWDGQAMAQQLIDSRLAFDRSIRDWKVSSSTWGVLMRFFDSPGDSKPTDLWRTLDERCERYIACIQTRYLEPDAKLGSFELADCSHHRNGIERTLEAWSDTLRTRAVAPTPANLQRP